jgi:hypothetical protein
LDRRGGIVPEASCRRFCSGGERIKNKSSLVLLFLRREYKESQLEAAPTERMQDT